MIARNEDPGRSVMASHVTGALHTDMYHVDAAYVAWKAGLTGEATFDLYTRSTPFGGGFLTVAGLEPALAFIRDFSYDEEEIEALRQLRDFPEDFFDMLRDLRFSGEILAMLEGEIAFPNEPLMRVSGPFHEALLLEAGLLRAIGVSTLIATKASRLRLAAGDRAVSDFALRRAQDPFLAARSAYLGGCDSTSFVGAASAYGIPASGTIPHALVQAFASERDAFRAVATALPTFSLLLDTYEVLRGIEHAIEAAHVGRELGNTMTAVRLDSGDLAADSRLVREALDGAGLTEVQVLASGDIDEHRISELRRSDAPIDGYGVGGNLGVGLDSSGLPRAGGVLGAVYKLAWFEDERSDDDDTGARIKVAGDKSTVPGRKQVWREGIFAGDLVGLESEQGPPDSRALLAPVLQAGDLLAEEQTSDAIRERVFEGLAALPEAVRALRVDQPYPVLQTQALQDLSAATRARFSAQPPQP